MIGEEAKGAWNQADLGPALNDTSQSLERTASGILSEDPYLAGRWRVLRSGLEGTETEAA